MNIAVTGDIMYALAIILRLRRQELSLSIKSLSQSLEISSAELCKIEAGVKDLPLPTLQKIAVALESNCADLLAAAEGLNISSISSQRIRSRLMVRNQMQQLIEQNTQLIGQAKNLTDQKKNIFGKDDGDALTTRLEQKLRRSNLTRSQQDERELFFTRYVTNKMMCKI